MDCEVSSNEEKKLMIISCIKEILTIFTGPFLAAYFYKISSDYIAKIALFYLITYIAHAVTNYFIYIFSNNKSRIKILRVGILFNCIYILTLIVLKEKIIDYLFFVAIISGISSAVYWNSFNLFLVHKANDKSRFLINNQIILSILNVLIPIVLASFITLTSYIITGFIIFILVLIQLIFSFKIKIDKKNSSQKK